MHGWIEWIQWINPNSLIQLNPKVNKCNHILNTFQVHLNILPNKTKPLWATCNSFYGLTFLTENIACYFKFIDKLILEFGLWICGFYPFFWTKSTIQWKYSNSHPNSTSSPKLCESEDQGGLGLDLCKMCRNVVIRWIWSKH